MLVIKKILGITFQIYGSAAARWTFAPIQVAKVGAMAPIGTPIRGFAMILDFGRALGINASDPRLAALHKVRQLRWNYVGRILLLNVTNPSGRYQLP